MKPLVFLCVLVAIFLSTCTQSNHKKILKPPTITTGEGYDENDTVAPEGFIHPVFFETSISDTSLQYSLLEYSVDDSLVPNAKVSQVHRYNSGHIPVNQFMFSINDTLRENHTYELTVNIDGKIQKNTYSDIIFEKCRVYNGWNVTLESYKKNGKVILQSKKLELEW